MATPKKNAITVRFARELKLTAKEENALRRAFKTEVAQVLGARPADDAPPLPEINIIRPIGNTRPSRKKSSSSKAKKR